MIKILIVDDSMVVCLLLKSLIEVQPDMQVIGIAHDGFDAIRQAKTLKPDLITMDVYMPLMDGLESTRQIMQANPCPIVMISSFVDDSQLKTTFRAFDYGALACITKPVGSTNPDFKTITREIIDTIRALAGISVIRRRPPISQILNPETTTLKKIPQNRFTLLAIASSTGGPQVLKSILSRLPSTFSLPILITQHISKGFIGGMISWLQESSALPIELAENGESLIPGHIYFAPDDAHLCVDRTPSGLKLLLSKEPLINGFRPSATALFESVSRSCKSQAIGLILTGMGKDGAIGLLSMRQAGAHTLAQDEASSIVYGMPGEAIKLEAVDEIIDLDNLPGHLIDLISGLAKK